MFLMASHRPGPGDMVGVGVVEVPLEVGVCMEGIVGTLVVGSMVGHIPPKTGKEQ